MRRASRSTGLRARSLSISLMLSLLSPRSHPALNSAQILIALREELQFLLLQVRFQIIFKFLFTYAPQLIELIDNPENTNDGASELNPGQPVVQVKTVQQGPELIEGVFARRAVAP